MASYTISINLHTEDPSPPYQITKEWNEENKKCYFRLPPHKMPVTFKQGDTIKFRFIGRKVIDCTLYVKPLGSSSMDMPFKPKGDIESVSENMTHKWCIVLRNNGKKKVKKIKIIKPKGDWDFTIAGTFKVPIQEKDGKFEYAKMPFLVDPECVVGKDD